MAKPGKHKNVWIILAISSVILTCGVGVPVWLFIKFRNATYISYSQSNLYIIHNALEEHAIENRVYPTGFGEQVWSGKLYPEMLCSPFEDACDLVDFDWGFELDEPRPDLDAFASEHTSYIVLVWGQARTEDPDVLFMYERLRKGSRGTSMMNGKGQIDFVSNAEAERRIRAAGHKPVWAD